MYWFVLWLRSALLLEGRDLSPQRWKNVFMRQNRNLGSPGQAWCVDFTAQTITTVLSMLNSACKWRTSFQDLCQGMQLFLGGIRISRTCRFLLLSVLYSSLFLVQSFLVRSFFALIHSSCCFVWKASETWKMHAVPYRGGSHLPPLSHWEVLNVLRSSERHPWSQWDWISSLPKECRPFLSGKGKLCHTFETKQANTKRNETFLIWGMLGL